MPTLRKAQEVGAYSDAARIYYDFEELDFLLEEKELKTAPVKSLRDYYPSLDYHYHPSIWMFIYYLNRILADKNLESKRQENFGADNVVRTRRPQVVANIQRRRDAEAALDTTNFNLDSVFHTSR